jgi:hypothetical protein
VLFVKTLKLLLDLFHYLQPIKFLNQKDLEHLCVYLKNLPLLPFKTEVLLSYKDNEQTTEKLILVNATFEDKKEELSKLIPHINFNI